MSWRCKGGNTTNSATKNAAILHLGPLFGTMRNVGFEMLIRGIDQVASEDEVAEDLRKAQEDRAREPDVEEFAETPNEPEVCLLYTSDAADE